MQIGAAFAVLQAQGEAAAPLELQAAKSRLLHLEPAAGAAGLGMLTARLQQQPSHETLHLRAVNPHVAAIFQVSLQPALPLQMLLSSHQIAQHYEQACLVLPAALNFISSSPIASVDRMYYTLGTSATYDVC